MFPYSIVISIANITIETKESNTIDDREVSESKGTYVKLEADS